MDNEFKSPLAVRIIPCLDVDAGRVVKGVKFKGLKDAGDPAELARVYYMQGADELTFLDIGASHENRTTMVETVELVSREVFIPLTVGGGVRTVDDIRVLLNAGADKVAVCTAALKTPALISMGAEQFGSQCIVLSIDAKRCGSSWHAFTEGGRNDTGRDVLEWAEEAVRLGAGEILLNSIDKDGTGHGYDLELTKKVSESVGVPVIASGGAGSLEQIYEAVSLGRAEAVLLASLLHLKELSIIEIKEYLSARGVNVR
ncbi:MAG: imidazole glycerol phosphate synthase subunit HisF [Candidatus Wallbacteria bacterium]|nr:imidazole glycerol phosphate synthase subunit HisF [Candidatus Wallbacteria bacterium]